MNQHHEPERGVSIIICTHNGAAVLSETLRFLCKQNLPEDLNWEVIIVDNASTDGSLLVAQQQWARSGRLADRLVCIQESSPGKYFALQTAMQKVRYAYFVICDDDNWLAADYIRKIVTILDADPRIGAVGGRGIPVTEGDVPLPRWFEKYREGYAVGPQGERTGDVTHRGHLWGAGMGSRTALYRAMYKKYPSFLLQLNDVSVMATEDSEYCLRLVLRGYTLYYDDALVYQHLIPVRKLNELFAKQLYQRFHASYAVNGKYFLALKVFRDGEIHAGNLLKIRLSGFFGRLVPTNFKRKTRANTKWGFLRTQSNRRDIVGWGIIDFFNDPALPKVNR